MSEKIKSPIQHISSFAGGINLYLKREDLIHKEYGGNKWRKLHYNLKQFVADKKSHLITFGGPFSNHLAATAAICRDQNISSVGIVRGEMVDADNPTLNKAKKDCMLLHHISKEEYRLKEDSAVFKKLIEDYSSPFIIPEGGNNRLGMLGMQDLMDEVSDSDIHFDTIIVAAGTGTTSSGIINFCNSDHNIFVINVLKNPSLQEEIESNTSDSGTAWRIWSDYHFGGFAKTNAELKQFARDFYKNYTIPLDPVYTSKMMYAAYDLIKKGAISENTNVLTIHTGGLQGIQAYDYLNKESWLGINI